MLRFVPPAGTPLEITEILRGAKATLFPAAGLDRSLTSLAEQVHAASAVPTCSGRAALWLVLKALHRLRPDRNIIVLPAYTCFTVPASAVRAGLKVCPVDISPDTLDFDFEQLEEVPSDGLLCMITSNLCGLPNDVERIRRIARGKDAFVVDDAAQALGASYGGSWSGLRGDAGIFSFGRGKALATMEGGLAVTNSREIAAAIALEAECMPNASSSHSLRLMLEMLAYATFLNPRRYWIPNSIPFLGLGATEFKPGFPISRMSGLTSELLTQIFPRLEEINAARVRIATSIANGLAGHPAFAVPKPVSCASPVYTRLPVITSDASIRDRAVARLRAAGIGASPFYPGAICDIPGLKPFAASGFRHCPMAESLSARLFTLPTHAYVDEQDISRIVEILVGVGWKGAVASRRAAVASNRSPVISSQPIPNPESRVPSPGRRASDPGLRASDDRYFAHHSSLIMHQASNGHDSPVTSRQSPVANCQPIPDAELRIPVPETRIPSPESRGKRLLLIAFDFPPRRTSGIYRPTGLTKYLVHLGWKTTVLTVNVDSKELQDPALLDRVPPQTGVVRTRYLNFMAWEDSTAGAARSLGALNPEPVAGRSSLVNRFLRKSAAFVRSCLYFPDHTSGWIPFGLARALQLCWKKHFDVVYSTSPPRSSLVIGLFLKLVLRTPWVAEFRDPWYPPPRRIRGWAERRLVRIIGHVANAIVVVTSGHADDLRSLGVPADKIKVVPNGFDEDDFHPDSSLGTNGLLKPGYIHFTHIGTVYPNCSGRFFEALKELLRECPDLSSKIRINVIGYPDEVVQQYAMDETLRPLLSMHGFIGHSHSIEVMRSSHCLLLFWANRNFAQLAIAGKTYEYLRTGRPILSITYNGPMKTLIQGGNAGWVIHPDDKHGMKQALQTVIAGGRGLSTKCAATAEYTKQFQYSHLAARMAAIFDGIADQP